MSKTFKARPIEMLNKKDQILYKILQQYSLTFIQICRGLVVIFYISYRIAYSGINLENKDRANFIEIIILVGIKKDILITTQQYRAGSFNQ